MNKNLERLLSIPETAAYLKVHPKTVQRMLWDGRIKGMKVGKEWRVKESAIIRFLETMERKTTSRLAAKKRTKKRKEATTKRMK